MAKRNVYKHIPETREYPHEPGRLPDLSIVSEYDLELWRGKVIDLYFTLKEIREKYEKEANNHRTERV